MSLLLLRRLSKVCVAKPAPVRYSLFLSNSFSSSLIQTPPCSIVGAKSCGAGLGKLVISNVNELLCRNDFEKKVPLELVKEMGTIGASYGWVATLNDDGVVRLQDDLNPAASDTDPKRIPLPPLVTLPFCQTKIVTNVSMSSSCPEDEDCVVAVKFLGPQISFCRPAESNSEWTNIRIQDPCFDSSRVMFSKKDGTFRMPGSGGHLIASLDLCTQNPNPKFQRLQFKNIPKLTKTKRKLMDSCCTTEHLVESESTGETFLVKQYKKTVAKTIKGIPRMKTEVVMVFKIYEERDALYTKDIGDLCIFLSNSEPFCVPASSFFGIYPNYAEIYDADGFTLFNLANSSIIGGGGKCTPLTLYYIPPQNIRLEN